MCGWLSQARAWRSCAKRASSAGPSRPAASNRRRHAPQSCRRRARPRRPRPCPSAHGASAARRRTGALPCWRGGAVCRKSGACVPARPWWWASKAAQLSSVGPAELAGLQGSVDGGFVLGCGSVDQRFKQRLDALPGCLFTMAAVSEISARPPCGQSARRSFARGRCHHGSIALGVADDFELLGAVAVLCCQWPCAADPSPRRPRSRRWWPLACASLKAFASSSSGGLTCNGAVLKSPCTLSSARLTTGGPWR